MPLMRVAVAGGEIACNVAGPRNSAGPALVLLHGWTLDHRMWEPQAEAFDCERLVLAPDRRGFGASTAPPDLGREADDVAALLDTCGAERAIVVGMSQAGRVALDFALRFADRLSALVLQGAPASGVTPGPAPEETIPIVEYANLVRAGRLTEMKRLWLAHPLMATENAAAQRLAVAMLEAYSGRDLTAVSYLQDADAQALQRIDAPALVITGERDTPWRRRAGDALGRALPCATRAEIAGAGHLCNLDQTEAFNRILRGFLSHALR